ncbi:hypothetical protein RUE5091_01000 [Ruegeria denitrificans]|uniref:Uncharacterized protein n=1 Tax=Ruegeria denitrificans TaxID=1715692 RepID=A0A0P1I568_9RHOB|nr:hypothetical protein [Ruegeria denitrificans]CUJ90573.1 hypothetical protein RUE5091_01000 [Ruegeria denitrificans]
MRALTLWLLPLLFVCGVAFAQSEEILAPTEERDDPEFIAPVIVDGEELFLVRGSSALPATERARKIEERIAQVADASTKASVQLEISDAEFGKMIRVDGQMVTITTQADAEHEQMAIEVLAGLQAEAIELAILQYRDARSNEGRVDSAMAAFAWTAVFALVSYAFFAKRRKLLDYIRNNLEKRAEGVEYLQSPVANVCWGLEVAIGAAAIQRLQSPCSSRSSRLQRKTALSPKRTVRPNIYFTHHSITSEHFAVRVFKRRAPRSRRTAPLLFKVVMTPSRERFCDQAFISPGVLQISVPRRSLLYCLQSAAG